MQTGALRAPGRRFAWEKTFKIWSWRIAVRDSSKAAKAHRAKQKNHTVARTYRVSIIEGIFAQIYGALANIGSNFITKFLVILGASPLHFSILSALGQVSALFQPLGVALTHRPRQRKKLCVWVTAAGRFLSIFIGSALLFSEARQGIAFVLALLFISAGLQAVGGNIWIAWISDIIPAAIRGRFFARRNQILVFSGLLAGYLLSYLTDSFEKGGGALRSFAARWVNPDAFFTIRNQSLWLAGVFVFASILGLAGLVILARQPDRKRSLQQVLPLRQKFGEPFRDKNFRLLMAFGIWWMLATGVGSAFWTPFMLKNLGLSMFKLQLYGSLHMVSSLLSYSFWGKFIDRWGNKPAMLICVILGGLNPMLWLFMTRQNYSLLWIEGLFSGFMWAGNGVATTNFVLAIAGKGREQSYSALYGAIGGVSMMATTLLSGIFYPQPLMLGSRLLASEQVIFGVGGILRWLSVIPLMAVNEKRSSVFQSSHSGY
ncbi:MAG: MFS transporter [Candidatus Cloacimonadaceae bacterium]|nr:MFS transporter [Candidatus Cloacimonadota bacterium]MDX9949846.1 MFS transporter [Candidatus Syntrophosphaera sp.]NLN85920.1 MFS transporter [Candidatus Cloacimonadota bacterium]